jgi:hypothetical protein
LTLKGIQYRGFLSRLVVSAHPANYAHSLVDVSASCHNFPLFTEDWDVGCFDNSAAGPVMAVPSGFFIPCDPLSVASEESDRDSVRSIAEGQLAHLLDTNRLD